MTPNISIYQPQPTPYEVEWVEFQGNNRYKLLEWVKNSVYLAIEEEYDGQLYYQTSDDYGRSKWDVLPVGSLICRNVSSDYYYVVLPDKVDDFKRKLLTINPQQQ